MKKRWMTWVCFLLAAMLLVGCAKTSYTTDGLVTVRNRDKDKLTYRIAAVTLDGNNELNVYVRGTEDAMACALAWQAGSGGFDWSVYVGAAVIAADGSRLEPQQTSPYLSNDGGNMVGFRFDTAEMPESILIFVAGNEAGGVTVPYTELSLSDEYAPNISEIAS